jgi:hydroxyethylthiazole kinase
MSTKEELINDLKLLREKSPLVHNITNYVVMNNTANALLAIGASPVMAHSVDEVEDMVKIASSLVINIGTLSKKWVKGMLLANKAAHKKGIPVVLDPVGAGATPYRNEVCAKIMEEFCPTIIRGNASEILSLSLPSTKTKGVDNLEKTEDTIEFAMDLANNYHSIIVISGPVDYITDGHRVEMVKGGSPLMTKVTGMGCTATAIIGAFAAINPDPFKAAMHAMTVMNIAGEMAAEIAKGPGTMQLQFLDTLYNLSEEDIANYIQ